eukprot:m.111739 g.111739  ORF g.111739 m.111739 type:complete len:84 (-) comp14070_c1_seq2:1421-1672(-)
MSTNFFNRIQRKVSSVQTFCGYDIDDLLSFQTPKYVVVRDYRLGLLNYSFQLAITLYIIVYAIVLEQGFVSYHETVKIKYVHL